MNGLIQKNNAAAESYRADRRSFLKHGLLFSAVLGFWTPALAMAAERPTAARRMFLTNVHTGEKFGGEYWYDGEYLPEAFSVIKTVMRDHRTNEIFPIDPRLMDVLYVLQNKVKNFTPFEVFSGYRSASTNARLRRMSRGVARGSLHMQGQAIDINQPGTRLSYLKKTAVRLRSGGVGFYPSSDFVHVDTGRARSW
ncbi:MAG: YcbK family protein [Pseudomonadota bacterium]